MFNPILATKIHSYAVLHYDNAFLLFGGTTEGCQQYHHCSTNVIAKLDTVTTQWNKVGELKYSRSEHGVIFDGNRFLAVGGIGDYGDLMSEICTPSEEGITCVDDFPYLPLYVDYPELLLVPDDFCADVTSCI